MEQNFDKDTNTGEETGYGRDSAKTMLSPNSLVMTILATIVNINKVQQRTLLIQTKYKEVQIISTLANPESLHCVIEQKTSNNAKEP